MNERELAELVALYGLKIRETVVGYMNLRRPDGNHYGYSRDQIYRSCREMKDVLRKLVRAVMLNQKLSGEIDERYLDNDRDRQINNYEVPFE